MRLSENFGIGLSDWSFAAGTRIQTDVDSVDEEGPGGRSERTIYDLSKCIVLTQSAERGIFLQKDAKETKGEKRERPDGQDR